MLDGPVHYRSWGNDTILEHKILQSSIDSSVIDRRTVCYIDLRWLWGSCIDYRAIQKLSTWKRAINVWVCRSGAVGDKCWQVCWVNHMAIHKLGWRKGPIYQRPIKSCTIYYWTRWWDWSIHNFSQPNFSWLQSSIELRSRCSDSLDEFWLIYTSIYYRSIQVYGSEWEVGRVRRAIVSILKIAASKVVNN